MILPVDVYLNLSLNRVDLLFRNKGDCLTDADLKLMRGAQTAAIRVKADELSLLSFASQTHILREQVRNSNFNSKEVMQAAAGLLSSIGNRQNETATETLRVLGEQVRDIISTMAQTTSVKAYFHLLDLAKSNAGNPLEIHGLEVSALAVLILMTFGTRDPDELSDIATAGLLHDLGLRECPQAILMAHCSGKNDFTGAEAQSYSKHPELTLQIIKQDRIAVSEEVLGTIELHHENWDGSGFKGIVGNRILKSARILRMADEFACRLAAASGTEKFEQMLSKVSVLADQSKTSLFDPDIMLSLVASLQATQEA